MNSLESLVLRDNALPKVKVNSLVILSIMNFFMRRSANSTRIMGTLVGEIARDGSITVTDCFTVPFSENLEERTVAITKDHHKHMLSFHRRNNRKDVVVGWFGTTTVRGELLNDNSALIQDFYADLCEQPFHLVVDTAFSGDKLQVRGFFGRDLKMGIQVLSKSFSEVKVHVVASDTDASLLSLLAKQGSKSAANPTVLTAALPSSSQRLEASLRELQRSVQLLQKYVDAVVEGKAPANRELGVQIMQALQAHSSQSLNAEQCAALQQRYQDLLMQAYLSSLAQTQTLFAEKLNQIL